MFRAKRPNRAKLIFWDGTGVGLVAKRLENRKFSWPTIDNGVMRLSTAQLQALLKGLAWRHVHEPRRTTVPPGRAESKPRPEVVSKTIASRRAA